jgi:hypothetical protein
MLIDSSGDTYVNPYEHPEPLVASPAKSKSGESGALNAAKQVEAELNDVDKAFQDLEREEAERANKQNLERNFINSVKDACDGDVDKFSKFKLASGQFRRDEISGEEYYSIFTEVVGGAKAAYLLPQLLKVLPDASKSGELKAAAKVYEEQMKAKAEQMQLEAALAKEKALAAEKQRQENEKNAAALKAQRAAEEAAAKEKAMKDSVLGRIGDTAPKAKATPKAAPSTGDDILPAPKKTEDSGDDWMKKSNEAVSSLPRKAVPSSVPKAEAPKGDPKESTPFDESTFTRPRGPSSEAVHVATHPGATAQVHDVKVGPRQTRWLPLKVVEGDVISWSFNTLPSSVVDFSATFVAGLADMSVDAITEETDFQEVFPFTRLAECADIFVAPANGVLKLEVSLFYL